MIVTNTMDVKQIAFKGGELCGAYTFPARLFRVISDETRAKDNNGDA